MVKVVRYGFAVACFGAAALIACGPGFLDGISGGARDGGVVAKADASTGDAGSCDHAGLPPRPPGNDVSGDNLQVPVFAFDSVRVDTLPNIDAGGVTAPLSYDIDQTCTCESQKDSCIRPGDAGAACDGPDGRDNTFGTLFNQIVVGIPLFPATFATDRIRGGHFTILVDLLGWNGKPDDPQVQVAVRQSAKLDAAALPDGGRSLPAFDGTDVWTVDPASISGGAPALGKDCRDPANAFACIGLLRDLAAYVANNELVAQPRVGGSDAPVTITLRTAAGIIALPFQGFGLHAKISGPVNGHYRLDGELTGRITATDLNTMFGNLEDFTSDDPTKAICNNPALFATSKQGVCALRDLSISGDASAGCDALSAAMSFGAGPANAGTVSQDDPLPSQCGDASFTCDE